ncbi:unnamed protein product [Gulo gulo]|uniref:Uncharacterized protein n=1 Tax=Gulo gulo TaxID=48420 RepID=A0A9X9LVS3_GULGU|nr:unnamed protein product [Gulo gulo]
MSVWTSWVPKMDSEGGGSFRGEFGNIRKVAECGQELPRTAAVPESFCSLKKILN